mgnify:CR=1 FL=1
MKIITLNCFLSPWSFGRKQRLPFIVKALVEENPDVLFLQEIFFESDAQYIIENLKKFGFVDSFYFKSLLTISKYVFTSRKHQNFKYHSYFNPFFFIIKILNFIYGKGFQILETKINKQSVVLVNTHLLSAYGWNHGTYLKARIDELEQIIDGLGQMNRKQIILGGDFNFDLNSAPYLQVQNKYGFIDPLYFVKEKTITVENLNRKSFWLAKMNERIDHIFIKGFKNSKISGEIVFREPYQIEGKQLHISDHFGLTLNLE